MCAITGHGGTQDYLFQRGFADSDVCPRCNSGVESVRHIIFECPQLLDLRLNCLFEHRAITGSFPIHLYDLLSNKKTWSVWEKFIEKADRFNFNFN